MASGSIREAGSRLSFRAAVGHTMGLIARRVAKRSAKYKSVDDYLKDLWRPLMAWVYAIVVLFDFMIAPIMLGVYCAVFRQPYIEWHSLTIQGGGMFHIAMGAVIGVSSYSHSQEKINSAPDPSAMPVMSWPSNTQGSPGFTGGAPASGGYGSAPAGFGAPVGGFGSAPVSSGFGSAPASSGFGSAPVSSGFGSPAPDSFTPPAVSLPPVAPQAPTPIAMDTVKDHDEIPPQVVPAGGMPRAKKFNS